MRKFTFKLQSCLNYKQYLQHLEFLKLNEISVEIQQIENKILDLKRQRDELINAWGENMPAVSGFNHFLGFKSLGLKNIALQLSMLSEEKLKKEQVRIVVLRSWLDSKTEVKKMMHLHSLAWSEWVQRSFKEEDMELDELGNR